MLYFKSRHRRWINWQNIYIHLNYSVQWKKNSKHWKQYVQFMLHLFKFLKEKKKTLNLYIYIFFYHSTIAQKCLWFKFASLAVWYIIRYPRHRNRILKFTLQGITKFDPQFKTSAKWKNSKSEFLKVVY